jgi:hypothetical protein
MARDRPEYESVEGKVRRPGLASGKPPLMLRYAPLGRGPAGEATAKISPSPRPTPRTLTWATGTYRDKLAAPRAHILLSTCQTSRLACLAHRPVDMRCALRFPNIRGRLLDSNRARDGLITLDAPHIAELSNRPSDATPMTSTV